MRVGDKPMNTLGRAHMRKPKMACSTITIFFSFFFFFFCENHTKNYGVIYFINLVTPNTHYLHDCFLLAVDISPYTCELSPKPFNSPTNNARVFMLFTLW